jgi:DNA-binding NtrC family response regulator
VTDRPGAFEEADGGTLFLDEIGELAPEVQPALLRALDKRAVRPVGGTTYAQVSVRVVAATNRNLRAEIAAKHFREDLYYRLAVVRMHVPPLRERPDDIALLVEHFARQFSGGRALEISREELERLRHHSWPGNVRELRNVVERAFVGCDGSLITLAMQASTPITTVAARGVDPDAFTVPIGLPLRDVERQFVLRTLAAEHNNKTRAADRLEISTKTLHNMLRRWGLLQRPLD